MTERTDTSIRKKKVLKSLQKHYGIVSHACKESHIERHTFYKWKKEDPQFNARVNEIDECALDEIESIAHKMIIEDRNASVTIFYLKTKGRKRGYIEKQEVEHVLGDMTALRDAMNSAAKSEEKEY